MWQAMPRVLWHKRAPKEIEEMQIKYVVSSYKDCTSVNNLIKELVKDMKE